MSNERWCRAEGAWHIYETRYFAMCGTHMNIDVPLTIEPNLPDEPLAVCARCIGWLRRRVDHLNGMLDEATGFRQ